MPTQFIVHQFGWPVAFKFTETGMDYSLAGFDDTPPTVFESEAEAWAVVEACSLTGAEVVPA